MYGQFSLFARTCRFFHCVSIIHNICQAAAQAQETPVGTQSLETEKCGMLASFLVPPLWKEKKNYWNNITIVQISPSLWLSNHSKEEKSLEAFFFSPRFLMWGNRRTRGTLSLRLKYTKKPPYYTKKKERNSGSCRNFPWEHLCVWQGWIFESVMCKVKYGKAILLLVSLFFCLLE